MGRVVGSGCASTAVVGCFAAVGYEGGYEGEDAETTAGALAYFGLAGEVAAEGIPDGAGGPGTFEPRLLDALANLAAEPARVGSGTRTRELTRGE